MKPMLQQLRDAMNQCGESRYRIAEGSGIAQAVLSRFASGQRGLTVETAERLADYLGYRITLQPKKDHGKRRG